MRRAGRTRTFGCAVVLLAGVAATPVLMAEAAARPARDMGVTLTMHPKSVTRSTAATFRWAASGAARCRLDRRPAVSCRSPKRWRRLSRGPHRFVLEVAGHRKTLFRWRVRRPSYSARTTIAALPKLYPAFDPDVPDYVTRCRGTQPVNISVATDAATAVAVDSGPARKGRFKHSVRLWPGQAFSFFTRAEDGSRTYHVRCLPRDFPMWSFSRNSAPSQDWYVLAPLSARHNHVIFFDSHGVPVWWHEAAPPAIDAKVLRDGTLAFASYNDETFGTSFASGYEIRRLDGSLVRELATVGTATDFHDLEELENGNYALLSYRPRDGVDLSEYGGPGDATVLDAEVQEITPDGDLVWSWNSADHIDLAETGRWWSQVLAMPTRLRDGRTAYDQFHVTSLDVTGDSLVISSRHTDAIYRIDRTTGAVRWKLGGSRRPDSLTVLGDPNPGQPFGAQHDARVMRDGSLTLHDNGTGLGRAPRAARFAIDVEARTATLVESITDPDAPFSRCCGSARRLDNGNWVINWGGEPTLTEVSAAGSRVFKLTLQSLFSYRAYPVPDGQISRRELRRTMTARHPR
jgi:hypothetical protein